MKFFSRSANLGLVIKNGIAANRIAGVLGTQTRLIKFEEGVVDIDDKDQETISMMLTHPDLGSLFWQDSSPEMPKIEIKQSEPKHAITEYDHGSFAKSVTSSGNKSEQEQIFMDKVTEMAKIMATQIVKDILEKSSVPTPPVSDMPSFNALSDEPATGKTFPCFGEELTVKEASKKYKVDGRSLNALINMKGMTLEEAITHKQKEVKK